VSAPPVVEHRARAGRIGREIAPRGTPADRRRPAGWGIGGFFPPTGYGRLLAEGREPRLIDGRHYVFETPIHVDYALINAEVGDRWGNLVYRKTARNFSPVMAMAARHTIASVGRVCALGEIDPEQVVTPGIFVKRIVQRTRAVAPSEVDRSKAG
ncbi:3-oxoacid CoA-transferase subunit A, partial [Pseudomonas aeruginosa]|uniref:3-oxoacid CoA-transferase subunit A n=1 Tax=Pseudomonas aeruginosa TaxID=287 RepID=UPI001CA54FBE